MTAEEPKLAPLGRYSINEACQALGIHRNTLRRYAKAGLITPGVRRATGRPIYTGADLLRLWRICY